MTSLREIELRPGEEAAEGARQKEEWKNGRSYIEGKAVRVTASDSGSERVSIRNSPPPRLRRDKGNLLKGARAETGVVVLNDAMISELFESRPTALSDE